MRSLRWFFIAVVCLALPAAAHAQWLGPKTAIVDGTGAYFGTTSNPLNIAGSFSASLTGFRPTTYGTPIAVTTGGNTGTLPAGTEVVATNTGTTNGAYCALGASATTSSQYIAPNGGWFAFAISGDTQLTCITSTSTTTVNMAGGSGLPTGTGGGGGSGGSGGNVTVIGPLGSQASTAGVSVTIASDQAAVAVKQATAANLNATVVGTGTFATQSAQSGTWTVQPGNTANTTAWLVTGTGGTFPVTGTFWQATQPVSLSAATSGGCTPYHLSGGTAASTNANVIKASAGQICDIDAINDGTGSATVINYLKIYDSASSPTCSSATGLKHIFPIPTGSTGAGFIRQVVLQETYTSGIAFCVVTGSNSDTASGNANTGINIEGSYK